MSIKTHKQVASIIKDRIKSGEYPAGEKLLSERDLSKNLNVGRALVRLALDQLLTENWLEMSSPRIRRVADSAPTPLWQQTSNLIATIGGNRTITEQSPEKLLISEKRIIGASQAINEAALAGLQLPSVCDEKIIISSLQAALPKGLVFFNEKHTCDKLVNHCLSSRMPIVSFGDTALSPYQELPFDSVGSNHYNGTIELVKALRELDCRKILYYHGDEHHQPNWRRERRSGLIEGCKKFEVQNLTEVRRIEAPDHCDDKNLFEYHAKMTAGLLMEFVNNPEKRPDAIMVESDVYLYYVGRALQLLGVEPNRDIILAGYDNYWKICPEQRWCNIIPAITVDKGDIDIGRQAVKLLLKRVAGELPEDYQHIKTMPTLIREPEMFQQVTELCITG